MKFCYAPGSRLEIRDAELTKLEQGVRVLQPETTELVEDPSRGYRASFPCLDTLLRQTPPTDDRIHTSHHGAIDLLPYLLVADVFTGSVT